MAPEHKEINRQVEVIWRMLSTIVHYLMVHAKVSEAYINFVLMYTTDHIFTVLPIKDLINKDGEPDTPFKLATGTKPLVSHIRVLFFSCVVQKYISCVDKKALNMRHQAQKGFSGVFVGIPQHQKGYLVYVTSTSNMISSYDIVFYENISSALVYMSQTYSKAMDIRPGVTYTPYDTSSKEQTGNIITFAQFEEGGLVSETSNDTESSDESDDDSIMPPLLIKEEIDAMNSGDESDDEPMSTEML